MVKHVWLNPSSWASSESRSCEFSLRPTRRGAFIIRLDCGTNMAMSRIVAEGRSRRSTRRRSSRPRFSMPGAMRRPARSCAAYLGRKLRERGWAEARRAADRGARRADGGARLCRRPRLRERPRRRRSRGAAMARGGSATALRAAGIGEEDGAEAREAAEDGRLGRPPCALPSAGGSGPFAAAEADRPAREKALAAMLRAGHPPRSRAAHRRPPGRAKSRDADTC